MSSAQFLYFIKAWAIWTEWRGQSIWPDTVRDDPFLTPSLSCVLYYGRVSSIFFLPEKWWYCVSRVTGEINAWMWEVARKSSCIFSDFLLYPLSLCAADNGPNKIHQGRREWGLIVFCRYRGQYQRSALLGTHWDSICWVKSVPFLLTSWLKHIILHSVLNKSSRAAHCGLPPSRTSIQTQKSWLQLSLIKPANELLHNSLIVVVVVVVADIRSLAIASPVRTFLQTTDMSWACHRLYIHSTFITWFSYSLCFGIHNCETTGYFWWGTPAVPPSEQAQQNRKLNIKNGRVLTHLWVCRNELCQHLFQQLGQP